MRRSFISLSNDDFFTPTMLSITLLPIAIIFAISFLSGFIFGDDLISLAYLEIQSYFNLDLNSMIENNWLLSIISSFDFLIYIFEFMFYLIVLYISWNIAILIGMSIVGLFAPYVIGIIQKRHYKEIELKGDLSIANTLFKTVKIIGQVAIFAILGFIFFWIPVINFIFFYIAFYYMFDKMLILDVGAEINTKEELEQILKKNRFRIKKHSFGLYLLNNIPVIGILFQIYTIIYMSHFYMIETKRVRNV